MMDGLTGFPSAPFGGIQIRPSMYWPRIPDGTAVRRISAHPLVHWLARWLLIDPWVEITVPRFKDADPILHKASGTVFCSHAQYEYLRKEYGA